HPHRRAVDRARSGRRVRVRVGRVGGAEGVVPEERADVVLEARVAQPELRARLLPLPLAADLGVVGLVVDRLDDLRRVAEAERAAVRARARAVLVLDLERPAEARHLAELEGGVGAVALEPD